MKSETDYDYYSCAIPIDRYNSVELQKNPYLMNAINLEAVKFFDSKRCEEVSFVAGELELVGIGISPLKLLSDFFEPEISFREDKPKELHYRFKRHHSSSCPARTKLSFAPLKIEL